MVETPNSFKARTFDVGDKTLSAVQARVIGFESGKYNVRGLSSTYQGVYRATPKRLQSPVDTEDEMWRWAEAFARAHAKGLA